MAKIGSIIERQQTEGVSPRHAEARRKKKAQSSRAKPAALPAQENQVQPVKIPGKTSGGFYSQPNFFSDAKDMRQGLESARAAVNQKDQAWKLAAGEENRLAESLEEQKKKIAKLYTAMQRGNSAVAKSLYDAANQAYTETYDQLETASKTAADAAAAYQPAYEMYTAAVDDYNAYIQREEAAFAEWKSKIRRGADIQKEIESMDAQLESTKKQLELSRKRAQLLNQFTVEDGLPAWVAGEPHKAADLQRKLDDLQNQRQLLDEENQWAKYFQYSDVLNAPDFKELSGYRSTANGKEEKFNALSGSYTETGFDDITYDFINGNQKAREHQLVNNTASGASLLGLDNNFLRQMTEEEVGIFNYLYAKSGPEKAYEYISDIQSDLTKRQRTIDERQWRQIAKESAVGSSLFSVLESPMKGLSYLGQIADYASDGKIDQNAGYNKFSYLNSAIRGEVSDAVEKNWGGVGSFAYQTGMSMADFLFNTLLSGGNQPIALGIMGSGAAADTTIRAKDRGLTDGQAMALGTIAGLAEVVTEKVSMEMLLNGEWTQNALGFIGKNALAEGSEEGAADLINLFADIMIAKDQSEWKQDIQAYRNEGFNEQEAFLKALKDQLLTMGLDMLGGGISGGLLAGGRVAIGRAGETAQNAENTRASGAAIRMMGDNMIDAIIEQGMEFDQSAKSRKLAERAKKKRDAGKPLSDAELGALFEETSKELDRTQAQDARTGETVLPATQAVKEPERTADKEGFPDGQELGGAEEMQEAQLQTAAEQRLWETARAFHVDDITAKRVDRIAKATRQNVEFYNDPDAGQNGYYDRAAGTIFVNVNSKNPVAQIIGHELTHSIEEAGDYQKLKELVFSRLQKDGTNLENLRERKKELYARHGVELADTAGIDSEIVAEYMEKNLLTDETSIREVVEYDRTLGQWIMDQIDKLLAALGNQNAQERAFLTRARGLYSNALYETSPELKEPNRKSRKQRIQEELRSQEQMEEKARSTRMDKEELESAYAAGEITEEEFEDALESILQDEGETGKEMLEGTERFSIDEDFAREVARWDRFGRPDGEVLVLGSTGDVLQGLGAIEQDIFIRSEKINIILEQHREMTLNEIKRIPEILDDPVLVIKSRNTGRSGKKNSRLVLFGTVRAVNGQPVLAVLDLQPLENGLLINDMQKVNSVYTRDNASNYVRSSEVLYADANRTIPMLRGFEKQKSHSGSSSDRLAHTGPEELLRSGYIGTITYRSGRVNLEGAPFDQVVGIRQDGPQRQYSFGGIHANRADMDALNQAKEMERQGVAMETIFQETGWYTGADGKWRYKIKQAELNKGRSPGELYDATAGDVEAGDVSRRRSMTAEERRGRMPDTGNEDTVFAESAADERDGTIAQAIDTLPDGKNYVRADRIVIFGNNSRSWGEQIENYINGKIRKGEDVQLLGEDGDLLKLTADTAGKASFPFKSDGSRMSEQEYEVKLNAEAHIDELARISQRGPVKKDKDKRHGSFAMYGWNYRTAYFQDFDGQYYKLKLSVAMGEDGNVVYNVGNIVKRSFPNVDGSSAKGGAQKGETSLVERVSEEPGDVKGHDETSFFLSEEDRERAPGVLPTAEDLLQEKETDGDAIGRLPAKAQSYLKTVERTMLDRIGNAMSVPAQAKRDYLAGIVREISQEYLKEGKVKQETLDRLFEQAYENGVIVEEAFYNQHRDLKNYLRTVPVTISEADAADITDYSDFRKSAFGRLRIVKEGGTPVDVVYEELQNMAPDLFPEQITHPADQLMKMFDVAKSIQRTEKSLDEYYSGDENFRPWAKNEFETAVSNILGELRTVKRYAEDQAKKTRTEKSDLTQEEVAALYKDLKKVRWDYEKAAARNLMTDTDIKRVNELLSGQITMEGLDPEKDNVKGIREVYAVKQAYEDVAKKLRTWNAERRGMLNDQADKVLETANDWQDKRRGILYARETMERNIQDIVPDVALAGEIIDQYFTPVHKAAADANRLKNRMREKIQEMDLSRKVTGENTVSQAHAVQLLGEAEDNIRVLEKSRGRIKKRDGKTLEEWKAVIADLWESSPDLNREKIQAAVEEFREIYDELFVSMNEARVRNGYEPVNYRQGYFPHFQPGNTDGILATFGKALGVNTEVTALPTTINGLTHTFKPGIRYMGNTLERIGFNTAYDALEGFDRYIEGAADVIYQTDNIQRLRALARRARYRTSDEGIRKQVDDVLADQRLSEEEKSDKIDKIYESGRFTLSNFVVELDEYTNLLANKKSRADRNMEQAMGRDMYNLVKALEGRVAANMVAVNPASWLTNFIPLTQGGAMLNRGELLRGMWDTLQAYRENDGFVDRSAFLTNRRGSDPLVRTWAQLMSARASKPMEWIDSFVADSLVRARYSQNLHKGLSEQAAMDEADQWTASVMADRSKGSTPTLFQRSNPLTKLFTQFQLEVNNQLSYVAKDMPRGFKEEGMAVLAAALFKFALGAFLFNEIYEYFIGRRPALDPIGILNETVGDLSGYELPNVWELGVGALTGDVPEFRKERENGYDTVANLAGNILESTPFIGGVLGGGRLPISNAIPSIGNLSKAAFNEEMPWNRRISTAAKELGKPLTYLAPPFGGGQLKKIFQGVKAAAEGGRFSLDAQGNKILQYPVYNNSLTDAAGNLMTGTLFGVTATKEGKKWIESGFKSLNAKQTETYLAMQEMGIDGKTAFDLISEIRNAKKTEAISEAAEQFLVLKNSDAPEDAKAAVYYGMLAAHQEKELLDTMDSMGADLGEVTNVLLDIKEADLMTDTAATTAKLEAIKGSALTAEEKEAMYRAEISDSRDDEIAAFDSAGLSFDQYLEAAQTYNELKAHTKEDGQNISIRFTRWVNQQGLDEEQALAMKESFTYSSEAKRYDEMIAAGLDDDAAYQIAMELGKLKPEKEGESVTRLQKYRTIVSSGLSREEQMQAMAAVMTESEYSRMQAGYDAGVSPETYVTFKGLLPNYDANGNNSFSQDEVTAAVQAMPGLTNPQRAALWQMQNKSWKPSGNPFDTNVGQYLYDEMRNISSGSLLPKGADSNGGIVLPRG